MKVLFFFMLSLPSSLYFTFSTFQLGLAAFQGLKGHQTNDSIGQYSSAVLITMYEQTSLQIHSPIMEAPSHLTPTPSPPQIMVIRVMLLMVSMCKIFFPGMESLRLGQVGIIFCQSECTHLYFYQWPLFYSQCFSFLLALGMLTLIFVHLVGMKGYFTVVLMYIFF